MDKTDTKLSRPEIFWVTQDYIGVSGGYLGDFTYRSHRDFYPMYCDIDVNPDKISGTTRERFIAILSNADPKVQAKILRGVVAKFPLGSSDLRDEGRFGQLLKLIERLESASVSKDKQQLFELDNREIFRTNLTMLLNASELETLCFDLRIDFDGLKGQEKMAKAREIILLCERTGRFDELRQYCQRIRPEVKW